LEFIQLAVSAWNLGGGNKNPSNLCHGAGDFIVYVLLLYEYTLK
jgi:hypothetical protein